MKRIPTPSIFLSFLIIFCGIWHTYADQSDSTASLRELAGKCDLYIGAAVTPERMQRDSQYRETLAREFNLITAENVMKFHILQPQRGKFNFAPADQLVEFAREQNMVQRGHSLIWHHMGTPDWVTKGDWTREELIEVMREHIHTVVRHFKGKVKYWDVVNEAIDPEKSHGFHESVWYRIIGADYIDLAFQFAHEADPDVLLCYNDFGGERLGKKSDAIFELAKGMQKRGIPIHGVGLQMHIRTHGYPEPEDLKANIARLGELGLQTQITELDVRLQEPVTQEKIERQAERYQEILQVCLESPTCTAYILWGFTDKSSWIPGFFKGYNDALIFNREYQPKPAYFSIQRTLMNHLQKENVRSH